MNDTIDTADLVELQDFRCADDDGCGVTVSLDPTVGVYVVQTIETDHIIATTMSPIATVAYVGAALIAYGTDGVQGHGSWSATVEQGREILVDIADHAHDMETLAAR